MRTESDVRDTAIDDDRSSLWQALIEHDEALASGLTDACFRVGIYLEHLEEASFHYEQRRDVLLDDPELAWTDLGDSDERLEAHLDGLVLGNDLALAVCGQQAEEGDAGELYAAVCVFCRQQRRGLLDDVIDGLDADDEERVAALRDALAAELPAAWEQEIIGWLDHEEAWRRRVAAHVIGYRRLPASEKLRESLAGAPAEDLPALLRALGRVGTPDARAPLWRFLVHDDDAIRYEAALALLRLGGRRAVPRLAMHPEAPGALLLLAIGGGSEHCVLMQEEATARAMPDSLLALGVLGAPESVGGLIDALQDPELAEAGALGLYLLTGAALAEEVFVPEEMDEDELFEDELEAYRRGELPKRPGGESYGETVERLAQDPAVWEAWWEAHGARFQPGVRYRLGAPCTPRSLVRTLQAEWVPRGVRQMAYDELVVRYSIDAPFESDLPVREQRRVIASLERQAEQCGTEVQPGAWYFARQRIEY